MLFYIFLLFSTSFDLVACQCDDISDVKLHLIFGYSTSNMNPVAVPWSNIVRLLNSSYYNNSIATLVYAHGFNEKYSSASVQTVFRAYMTRRNEFNLLFIDWGKYADGNYYLKSIPNLIKVSGFFSFNYVIN